MPTASSLVATMSAVELRLFSQIPTEISLETSPQLLARQIMSSILQGSSCCWASHPCSIAGEAVSSFYLGTSRARTFDCYSDFDGLQHDEFSL